MNKLRQSFMHTSKYFDQKSIIFEYLKGTSNFWSILGFLFNFLIVRRIHQRRIGIVGILIVVMIVSLKVVPRI